MKLESEHTGPSSDCPYPELWHAADAQASEAEVGIFLGALVQLIKPEIVIETGTYLGYTTSWIIAGLTANDRGHLWTCETNENYFTKAQACYAGPRVSFRLQKGIDLIKELQAVDLAFIDSGGDRLQEAKALDMSKHGYVVLHDSRHKDYAEPFHKLGWHEIFFPTPRGVTLYKVQ